MIKSNTYVQNTYDTTIEGIIYCIIWKLLFVWLLSQPPTPKIWHFLTVRDMILLTSSLDTPVIFVFRIAFNIINAK